MDFELQEILQDCTAATNRLLDLLDQDKHDISDCINGEILAEYQRGTDKALRIASEIKADLLKLQTLE